MKLLRGDPVKNVQCDATSYCADGSHCCFYSTGAVAGCCTDGYTCDVAAGTCDQAGKKSYPFENVALTKKPEKKIQDVNNVQCDATSYCADGSHCCFYSTGAVAGCCTDGYTCDVAAGTCDQAGKKSYPFMITVDRKKAKVLHVESKAHCSEVHIPAKEYKAFMADKGWSLKAYKRGNCEATWNSKEQVTRDAKYKGVYYVKRGKK